MLILGISEIKLENINKLLPYKQGAFSNCSVKKVEVSEKLIDEYKNNAKWTKIHKNNLFPINYKDEQYLEYILDRTFSIYLFAKTAGGRSWIAGGTAWIISKTNSDKKYEFWIATNWHVAADIKTKLIADKEKFFLAYNDKTPINYDNEETLLIDNTTNEYTKFKSVELEPENKFIYDKNEAIDFFVFKADFGLEQDFSQYTKNKLNKINQYISDNKILNTYLPPSQKLKEGDKVFIAGFPSFSNLNKVIASTGETHFKSAIGTVNCCLKKNEEHSFEQIKDKDGKKTGLCLIDNQHIGVSPRYIFDPVILIEADSTQNHGHNQNSALDLAGGSSGSMIIDENFNIVGIYWGGVDNLIDQTNFYHVTYLSGDIFFSEEKNFIEPYF